MCRGRTVDQEAWYLLTREIPQVLQSYFKGRYTRGVLLLEHALRSFCVICPGSLLPSINGWKFCPEDEVFHEIVGTHGEALLPERAPGACSRSKTPRVYRP